MGGYIFFSIRMAPCWSFLSLLSLFSPPLPLLSSSLQISRSLQISSDLSRSLKISQDLSRSLQISPDLSRSLQICADLASSPNLSRSLQISPDLSRSLQISPGLSRSLQISPDLSAGLCARGVENLQIYAGFGRERTDLMTRKDRSYDGFRRSLHKSTSLGPQIPQQYNTFSTQCVQSVELSAKIRL